jgi:hypothetical protein
MKYNCLSCKSTKPTECLLCKISYYAETNGICNKCAEGCEQCSSLFFCKLASDGYYLTLSQNLAFNGGIQKCNSPCQTCVGGPNFCLSCVSGFIIDGSSCFSEQQIVYEMTFTYPSIFNDDDTFEQAYSKILLKYR